MRHAPTNLALFFVLVILVSIVIGNERVPVCDVEGEAVPGSVVEVRMFVDGEPFDNWQAGMCPGVIERLRAKLDDLVTSGGPF